MLQSRSRRVITSSVLARVAYRARGEVDPARKQLAQREYGTTKDHDLYSTKLEKLSYRAR
jgi:hypothetical protein